MVKSRRLKNSISWNVRYVSSFSRPNHIMLTSVYRSQKSGCQVLLGLIHFFGDPKFLIRPHGEFFRIRSCMPRRNFAGSLRYTANFPSIFWKEVTDCLKAFNSHEFTHFSLYEEFTEALAVNWKAQMEKIGVQPYLTTYVCLIALAAEAGISCFTPCCRASFYSDKHTGLIIS